ncbi:MAG: hypothetical protein AUJ97_05650 [Bacteroidetes bacterium CG2_30_32_10]|nr:MAG: hypothetical protein AUJ97_05650 [Bacteroidetes bacterium CG2_30_32_10]
MKTKLKNIIFIILISGIIISCHCKNTYKYVPDENKLIYQQDELVIFKSNLGNSDTFRIEIEKHMSGGSETACGFMSWSKAADYEEFIRTNYIDVRTGKIMCYFELKIDPNSFSFHLLYEDYSCKYNSVGTYTIYTINDIDYNNVNYYKSLLANPCIYKEVYFNKPFGLLKYKLKNDEEWTIQR